MKNFGFIKVAAAIPELKVADCLFNVEKIRELILEAVNKKVQIVCFPELSITGYTCGDLFFQQLLIKKAEEAVQSLLLETAHLPIIFIIGAPIVVNEKLYNVALVCTGGQIAGIVPKSFLPNYAEFYEKRWFHPAEKKYYTEISYAGQTIPFGTNLLFGNHDKTFAIEICEDLWSVIPPSSHHALAGAQIVFNLSASNDLTGKHAYLISLIQQQSSRCLSGYVYSSAGWGESTTDVVYGGNAILCENGKILASSQRFQFCEQLIISEIDIERLNAERVRNNSFRDSSTDADYLYCELSMHEPNTLDLTRRIHPTPFIPSEDQYNESCEEIFSIQIGGLAKRLLHTQAKTSVIGISGGLDSTLALLVCARAHNKIGLSLDKIVGVTMPGFGTTERTYNNAIKLMQTLGISIREIDIKVACEQHFKDINHDPKIHDVTYENVQARERTQILMDIANQTGGLVIGTGDLSESALGWATYNGDHMSMYGVNSSIPKTLVRHLVKWVAETQLNGKASQLLLDIIETPVSPELIPSVNGTINQYTEEIVGPYELHDFFLYYMLRFGFYPYKIAYLAQLAFQREYTPELIIKWLEVFYKRFFSQQFKRSCMPDGPKVGSVNLSPRGDWRMPSDASVNLWLKDIQNSRQTL